jgi:hypothetical protein
VDRQRDLSCLTGYRLPSARGFTVENDRSAARFIPPHRPAHPELKRLIPGGHVLLQFADLNGLESAAGILGQASRDDNELTLQVPTDGSVSSLKAVLDQLDHQAITVEGFSVHTPDLDDVFFALTGQPETQKGNVR